MRLHRIALSNYRGVRHAEVSPALSGVTIVQGPNEIGKSSLAEALELLFEELDSSSKAKIRAIKPVDLDAGPEVEVELTTGPYHVIYTKRWKPGASTRLRLLAPKPESLTGRSAHERMTAILEETLDEGLWRALRHQQGVSITQASLGDCRTLASTLDAAAGGTVAGEDQTDLWERVQAERRLYFTAAGKPTGERVQVGARVSELSARAQALERELAELEDISVRHRELGVELATNREQQARRGELLIDQQAAWDDLQEVRGEVDNRRLIVEATAASLREVEVRLQERERSIEAVDLARAELESLLQGATLAAPGRHAAESAQRRALAARDEASATRRGAEEACRRADADHSHLRDVADHGRLVQSLGRAREHEAKQGQALAFLESCAIDADRLAGIEEASQAALEAAARLAGQAATLRVEALGPLELQVGAERHALSEGESREVPATGELQLKVGELALLTVSGAAAGRELEEQAQLTGQRLEQLLADAGVFGADPMGQARALARRRGEAEAEVARAAEALRADLGDLTVALVAEKIERAQLQLASYQDARASDTPLPESLEQAKAASERAAVRAAEAERGEALAQQQLDAAERSLEQIRGAANQRDVRIEIAQGKAADRKRAIEEARQQVPDAELRALAVQREIDAAQAQEDHAQAAQQLAGQDAASAEAVLGNSLAVLERLRAEERELDLELAQIAGVLQVRGEAGLHDQLAAVRSELSQRERQSILIERRAAAAELLHDCLARHRDAAQRAYVAPFKVQLDALAKIVFGPSVTVEVNHEDLEISSRTLDGVTVPYESLSAGAREQLCVLSRLACAALVSPATESGQPGGVPVIFDDALGYSDATRLEAVGAAFNLVGEHAQVIVLTCVPERYRNIGSAKTIRLASTVGGNLRRVGAEDDAREPQAGGAQPQTALPQHA